jgi:hypothetical protein
MALKRLAFMFVLSIAATAALAQEEPPPPQPPMPPQEQQVTPPVPPAPVETPAEPETTGTREVAAEVVSPDAPAKAINVKIKIKKEGAAEPEVKEARIKVDDEALPDLDTVSPGDKVKLLCRMNGNSVIAVKDINKSSEP